MSKTTKAVEAARDTDEGHLYAAGWVTAGIAMAATVLAVWQLGL